ncbi:hypothetical protein X975_17530, partial [Stegodyphus mimosarum]
MNTLTVLVLASAVVAVCFADENETDRKTMFIRFYKCISCGYETETYQAYVECAKHKPQRSLDIIQKCVEMYFPPTTTESELTTQVCENPEIAGKVYECMVEEKEKIQITEEEKESMKKFMSCAKDIYKAHCKE